MAKRGIFEIALGGRHCIALMCSVRATDFEFIKRERHRIATWMLVRRMVLSKCSKNLCLVWRRVGNANFYSDVALGGSVMSKPYGRIAPITQLIDNPVSIMQNITNHDRMIPAWLIFFKCLCTIDPVVFEATFLDVLTRRHCARGAICPAGTKYRKTVHTRDGGRNGC